VHMVALDRARVARDNVALIVQLFDGKRNRSVIVANTHLYYHPEYEDVRLVQTRYLLQKLEQFKGNEDCDVLLCGDFNATPFGAVYNYITQGSIVDGESKAPSIDRVKLLLEGDLKKMHKWLRMLGVDASFERTTGKMDYELVLQKAKSESRIVITRNKKLTERRNCPRYILVPFNFTHEQALKLVIQKVGLEDCG
jgi:endonuclease/exonuclease/phosphatase family metal-dependent hydrolase